MSDYCTCGGATDRHGYCKYCKKVSKLTAKSYEDFKKATINAQKKELESK